MARHRMRTRRQRIARLGPKRTSLAELRNRRPKAWGRCSPWLNADLTPKSKPERTIVLTLEELQTRAQRVAELQARVDPAWLETAIRFSAPRA